MTLWEVDVNEMAVKSRTYIVEAETEEEARLKAEFGDTEEEHDTGLHVDVMNRHVFNISEV